MKYLLTLLATLTVSLPAKAASLEERFNKACPELVKKPGVCECISRNYAAKVAKGDDGISEEDFTLIVRAYEGKKDAIKKLETPKYAELGFMDEDLTKECEANTKFKIAL